MDKIRDALNAFLHAPPREHFDGSLTTLFATIEHGTTKLIGGEFVETKPYEQIDDLAIVSEVERFITELADWSERIHEVREDWLWRHESLTLPDDLRSVFGELCDRHDALRARVRRILRFLDSHAGKQTTKAPTKPLEQRDIEFLTEAVNQMAVNGVYVASLEIWDSAGYRGEKLPRGITKRLKEAGFLETTKKGVTVTAAGEAYIRST